LTWPAGDIDLLERGSSLLLVSTIAPWGLRIKPVVDQITTILTQDDAATSVEYAVLLALIILTAFGAVLDFGTQASTLWGTIKSTLEAVGFF
jgi:Flp pilus assembly pilin Flp